MKSLFLLFFIFTGVFGFCQSAIDPIPLPGAYQMNDYLPPLRNKRIAVVANHTSFVGNTHLVDTLLHCGVNVVKVFAPEHGFRGNAADGATVKNETDAQTGLPIISLYGNHKKPTAKDLRGVDMVVFDIQDVGTRFYTYISTLTYVMEACAENKVSVLVLDRPNPNGFYVDGPVLKKEFSSFVGLHTVPIVYGMTIGEYALMVNGEKWFSNSVVCRLQVVLCKNYSHKTLYQLPVNPSPNIQNMDAVYLYPSLCLFEGTVVSVGRGTEKPFRQIGYPKNLADANTTFTPKSIKGVSDNPPLKDQLCYGYDLTRKSGETVEQLRLHWLLTMYKNLDLGDSFFIPYFEKLAGTDALRQQIEQGLSEAAIRKTWQADLAAFKQIRKRYLLYDDF